MTDTGLIIAVAVIIGFITFMVVSAANTRVQVIKNEKLDNGNYTITVRFYPVLLFKWFGAKLSDTRYIGKGTVWYDMKTQRRAGTVMESYLSDKLEFIKMKGNVK